MEKSQSTAMANSKFKGIAEQVAQLSPETQLGLLERLVHQLRAAITGVAPLSAFIHRRPCANFLRSTSDWFDLCRPLR
jgi:hypothetical protein